AVTWDNRDATTPWSIGGGGFVSPATDNATVPAGTRAVVTWDVLSDVQALRHRTAVNNGLIVPDANEGTGPDSTLTHPSPGARAAPRRARRLPPGAAARARAAGTRRPHARGTRHGGDRRRMAPSHPEREASARATGPEPRRKAAAAAGTPLSRAVANPWPA